MTTTAVQVANSEVAISAINPGDEVNVTLIGRVLYENSSGFVVEIGNGIAIQAPKDRVEKAG